MGERCLYWEVFLKCPRGDKGSAETGNPWPVLYENISIAQSLQREKGMISPGTCTHTHTYSHTDTLVLKNAAEVKGDPSVKHQSTSVHPRSKFNALLFFHLLPTACRELLKLQWAGMALL